MYKRQILDHLTPVDNLAAAMEGKCIEKINLVCIDPANRAAILSGLEAIRGISFIVFDTSIEINSATATKGDALKHLCRFLDIPLEDAMAIGDSDNDLALSLIHILIVLPGQEIRSKSCASSTA